jgi:hypothetical protein
MGNKTTYHDENQYALFCISSNRFLDVYAEWLWPASNNYLFVHKATVLNRYTSH